MALLNGFRRAFNITPSDLNTVAGNFSTQCDALLVVSIAGGATAAVVMPDDTVIPLVGLTAGQVLPLKAKRINATGTLATMAGLSGN